jgi:Family of unknown function (DUF6220)
MRFARYAYAAVAWLFVVGVLTQAFLAGAGLFRWTTMLRHMQVGYAVIFIPVLMLLLALPARVDRRTALFNLGLFVLAFLQPILAWSREDAPVIAALHPVNALVMFMVGIVVARRANALVRASRRATGDQPPARASSARPQLR